MKRWPAPSSWPAVTTRRRPSWRRARAVPIADAEDQEILDADFADVTVA